VRGASEEMFRPVVAVFPLWRVQLIVARGYWGSLLDITCQLLRATNEKHSAQSEDDAVQAGT
jgi:hypothetical protein